MEMPGERLHRERIAQGHTNRQAFARLTKTRPSTLSAFEDPKTGTHRSRYLPAWCAPLNLNPLWVEKGDPLPKYVNAPGAGGNANIDVLRNELVEVVRSLLVATPDGAARFAARLRGLLHEQPRFVFAQTLLGLIEAEQALQASLGAPIPRAPESRAHKRP